MLSRRAIATFALLALGVGALTYPFAAQWNAQLNQSRASAELAGLTELIGPAAQAELRDAAEGYNADLAAGMATEADHERYLDSMSVEPSQVIARLRVPSIDLDQPILHTMDESALLAGVGHAEGTSLPVGGSSTHAVLGGHRGLAESVGFTHLPSVKVGDTIYVESLGQVLTYTVISTEVLEPLEAAVHPIEAGRDLLTLLTCTPMGVNSHRFVVTAERQQPGDEVPAGLPSDQPGFPWFAVLGAGGLVLAGSVAYATNRRKPAAGARTGG